MTSSDQPIEIIGTETMMQAFFNVQPYRQPAFVGTQGVARKRSQ
jgi:hypothetical protein